MEDWKTIDEYIAGAPEELRERLQQLRRTIREAAPEAEERIRYRMPTFWLQGNLVHFAAFRNHIGFYPAPEGITAFREELSRYKTSKGAIQFPLDEDIPYGLVREIVRYRAEGNLQAAAEKQARKKQKTLTVEALVKAPLEKVWKCYTEPEHIRAWNSASPDWHTPWAENDLRPGGRFRFRMEARDGSAGFDFEGTYEEVRLLSRIRYRIADGRAVETHFLEEEGGIRVRTRFEAEAENPLALQQAGWQAILDHFKAHVEVKPDK